MHIKDLVANEISILCVSGGGNTAILFEVMYCGHYKLIKQHQYQKQLFIQLFHITRHIHIKHGLKFCIGY